MGIWSCKIGQFGHSRLPEGCDLPMRAAVRLAYLAVTGEEPAFLFSGWDGHLDEAERAVAERRAPRALVLFVDECGVTRTELLDLPA